MSGRAGDDQMKTGLRWTLLAAGLLLAASCARQEPSVALPKRTAAAAQARATAMPAVPLRADALQQAATHALLTSLIDSEADEPRFADPQWPIVCAERTTVLLRGQPVREGERLPAASFVLDWSLDGACPLGPDGPLLFGPLQMLVLRDDAQGLVPLVLVQP